MDKTMNHLIVGILLLLILSSNFYSQIQKIGVELAVSAEDSIQSQIESLLRNELRKIPDVDLYSNAPEYRIGILAIKPADTVVLSVIVMTRFNWTSLIEMELADTNVPAKNKDFLLKLFEKDEELAKHFVGSRHESEIRELCERVIATVDNDVFESKRQRDAKRQKSMSDSNNRPATDTLPTPRTTQKPVTTNNPEFEKEFIGGDSSGIRIVNDTNQILTLKFGGATYPVKAKANVDITVPGGRYEFYASVPAARPTQGVEEFSKGYRYTWRFFVVRR